jgi:hypothetical protein
MSANDSLSNLGEQDSSLLNRSIRQVDTPEEEDKEDSVPKVR